MTTGISTAADDREKESEEENQVVPQEAKG